MNAVPPSDFKFNRSPPQQVPKVSGHRPSSKTGVVFALKEISPLRRKIDHSCFLGTTSSDEDEFPFPCEAGWATGEEKKSLPSALQDLEDIYRGCDAERLYDIAFGFKKQFDLKVKNPQVSEIYKTCYFELAVRFYKRALQVDLTSVSYNRSIYLDQKKKTFYDQATAWLRGLSIKKGKAEALRCFLRGVLPPGYKRDPSILSLEHYFFDHFYEEKKYPRFLLPVCVILSSKHPQKDQILMLLDQEKYGDQGTFLAYFLGIIEELERVYWERSSLSSYSSGWPLRDIRGRETEYASVAGQLPRVIEFLHLMIFDLSYYQSVEDQHQILSKIQRKCEDWASGIPCQVSIRQTMAYLVESVRTKLEELERTGLEEQDTFLSKRRVALV